MCLIWATALFAATAVWLWEKNRNAELGNRAAHDRWISHTGVMCHYERIVGKNRCLQSQRRSCTSRGWRKKDVWRRKAPFLMMWCGYFFFFFFPCALWSCAQVSDFGPFPLSKKTQLRLLFNSWQIPGHLLDCLRLCASCQWRLRKWILPLAALPPSEFNTLWGGAMHDGYIHQRPASQPTPNLLTEFPLWGFWVGTILCNWSLWAPSTHSTVGWTESPQRRQLLGHPGQAGRSGRRWWRFGGPVAAMH